MLVVEQGWSANRYASKVKRCLPCIPISSSDDDSLKFRNVSKHLIGVDLSPSIIEEAIKARPGLYDETKVGDVTEVFREKKPVSLIIAGDSYIYFGDLVPLFQSMEDGLMDGGIAAFTLENPSDEFEVK